jgi:hypothetical protein
MSTKIIKKKISVSIITINQLLRSSCLQNLYELIKLQIYKNIIEWVIVEGSPTKEAAIKNKICIDNLIAIHLKTNSIMKIVYIDYSNKKLSDLRNLGNNKCIGEIIVCMDDDDYYPPERISSAVNTLENSSSLIAGCSDIYLYEYFMDKLYKFKGFHAHHGTNNTFVFKKEYLKNHCHQSGLDMSEEKSFTNDFTEKMVQLESKKCIIVSSHDFNTFNKREICVGGSYGINPSLYEVTDHPITSYIPEKIYDTMKNIFYTEADSPYDIVYYLGGFGTAWNPSKKDLGGSEQAIVNLSETWIKMGLKIAVYGDFLKNNSKEFTFNLVDYKNWKNLPFNHRFKTIILWRVNGLFCGLPFNLKAKNILWDIHDNFMDQPQLINCYSRYKKKISKILLKSNYHLKAFEEYFNVKLNTDQYIIIANGIMVDKFSKNIDNVKRNPYRFCYVSYYSRGLQHIIPNIWYIIKQLEPRAELHLYYGMEMFDDNIKKQLKILTAFSGVVDHGRQPIEMISREKYMSSFQLYLTNTISEIDCISIRESLVTGCIPLISNFGVFAEREGIHFNLIDSDQLNMKNIAIGIINLMKDQNKLDILRNVFKKSHTIYSWNDIAVKILQLTN